MTSEEFAENVKDAQAALAAISELRESAKTAHAEAQAKAAEIAAVATQALAARTQINDLQTVIATKSDHIQQAQDHADTVRAGLDRTLTAAMQQAPKQREFGPAFNQLPTTQTKYWRGFAQVMVPQRQTQLPSAPLENFQKTRRQ